MKMMKKMLSTIVLLITIVSCATTTPVTLPEKYNLDNDLRSVKQLSAIRVSNWVQVDNQSLIFTANGSKFYLAVLDRPLESNITNQAIGIAGQGNSITAGSDNFLIRDSSGRHYYGIEKIYELKGKEEAKKIKERLSNN